MAHHFIAINAHQFHDLDDIERCCVSVLVAVRKFEDQCSAEDISVCLFVHQPANFHKATQRRLSHLGIQLLQPAFSSNGENLNLQIDFARNANVQYFYRVDGDDIVFPDRFVAQSKVLLENIADICGGGLVYFDTATTRSHEIYPKQQPTPMDYFANAFMLHSTLAFRLEALAKADLRYQGGRLEDKALFLEAANKGLRLHNDRCLYGRYFVHQNARTGQAIARRALELDLAFSRLRHVMFPWVLPWIFYGTRRVLGPSTLRKLRAKIPRYRSSRLCPVSKRNSPPAKSTSANANT